MDTLIVLTYLLYYGAFLCRNVPAVRSKMSRCVILHVTVCCVVDQSHGVDVGSRKREIHKLADKTSTAARHETDVTRV